MSKYLTHRKCLAIGYRTQSTHKFIGKQTPGLSFTNAIRILTYIHTYIVTNLIVKNKLFIITNFFLTKYAAISLLFDALERFS